MVKVRSEMSLIKLVERFHSEDECRAYLEELRWPDRIVCPRCGGKIISRIKKRPQFDCNSCRYQFSVTAGTIFNDTHLPLWKWFGAVYLIVESKKGISAKQMERTLGTPCRPAWPLSLRIRSAFKEVDAQLLKGAIEVDETFV